MDNELIFYSITIFLFLLISALFSAAETALTAVSRARIYQLIMDGDKRAQIVSRLHRAEPGAQAGVEEDEPDDFVAPDVLIAVRVSLNFQGLPQQRFVVARIGEGSEVFHGFRIRPQERCPRQKAATHPAGFTCNAPEFMKLFK